MTATAYRKQRSAPKQTVDIKCELRCLLCEFIGTFLLVLAATAPAVLEIISGHRQPIPRLFGTGLIVSAMIWVVGDISGAHFNPAVTIGFFLRRVFPLRRVPGYILAQTLGGMAGSLLLLWAFGNVGELGVNTVKHGSAVAAFAMEIILSTTLILVILGTAVKHKIMGNNAAMAVGGTIVLCHFLGTPYGGAGMNPARSFAPAIIGHHLSFLPIYLSTPFIGAVLAVIIMWLLEGEVTGDHEREVAQGSQSKVPAR
jgi:MIP family channel proteins